jgi:hypothetical protein
MNFDKKGYMRLSPRMLAFYTEEVDGNFDLVMGFGKNGIDSFYVQTTDEPFDADFDPFILSMTEDTSPNNPSGDFNTHGIWFKNLWHVMNSADNLWYDNAGTWTSAGISLGNYRHPMVVNRARVELCIANGNVVKQYNTSYASTTDLTLPVDFEVSSLAYINGLVGVGTQLSDAADNQNGEAYFFTWDGSTTGATGAYPVGSDAIMQVVAYKSSFVVLTRRGDALYFNGGGFTKLFTLPYEWEDVTYSDPVNPELFNNTLFVDGERIYINIGNHDITAYGKKGFEMLPTFPAGILCYDPDVGLYHRLSHSASRICGLSVTSANVNTTTNVFTASVNADFDAMPATGSPIKYVDDVNNIIGGLEFGRVYYLIKLTSTTFKLAETYDDAIAGTAIDITSTGDSKNDFIAVTLDDFGQTYGVMRTGAIVSPSEKTDILDSIIASAEVPIDTSLSPTSTLSFACSGFRNIGYAVTPRIYSQNAKDFRPYIALKYAPLDTGDVITVKQKTKDILGLPAIVPQYSESSSATWSSSTVLTTTADLSEAMAYLEKEGAELEIEITAGAGGGQMSQIASITESSGTYTVTLEDTLLGIDASDVCTFIIDSWKTVGTITSSDTDGIKTFTSSGSPSKFVQYKIILDGIAIEVEDISIDTLPSQDRQA